MSKLLKLLMGMFMALLCVSGSWGTSYGQAITLGKTYDKSNVQEIKGMLIPTVYNWVLNEGWSITTTAEKYDFSMDQAFLTASKKNEGKFDVDDAGNLVLKGGGERKGNIYGLPFPTLDTQDPKIAVKLWWNKNYGFYRTEGTFRETDQQWVGYTSGFERSVYASSDALYYQGRRVPIPNPKNYLQQAITRVTYPFDLRGTVQMGFVFDDPREDSAFAYIPMLRRLRRVSAASRSDPFLGGDSAVDDTEMYWGKISAMTWKLLGDTTILTPQTYKKKLTLKRNPDGSYSVHKTDVKCGYAVPGWQGAKYLAQDLVWTPLSCWILEANHKDPYYNYGKQIFYLEKSGLICFFKIIYDKSGTYWKTILNTYTYADVEDGETTYYHEDLFQAIDDRSHHSLVSIGIYENGKQQKYVAQVPLSVLNEDYYSETNVRQMAK